MTEEERRWSEIFAAHPRASRITAQSVGKALENFAAERVRDLDWLARAIQPAVYLAAQQPFPAMGPSNVRDELQSLAMRSRQLRADLFSVGRDVEDMLWRFADTLPEGANAEFAAYEQSLDRLGEVVAFLDGAAAHAAKDAFVRNTPGASSKKWKDAAERDLRKWFAVWLSPAFEGGFARPAAGCDEKDGSWTDFYTRIAHLAELKPRNVRKVLAEARKVTSRGRAADDVVRFPVGWFPE